MDAIHLLGLAPPVPPKEAIDQIGAVNAGKLGTQEPEKRCYSCDEAKKGSGSGRSS